MKNQSKWSITKEQKNEFISALTTELTTLRTKAGISQEELSSLIGISRQTYSALERKVRKMSWDTYLALILFYDYNQKTHSMLRASGAFPYEILRRFNDGTCPPDVEMKTLVGDEAIISRLDEQALRSIRTFVMLEYARCTHTPGDVVIKSFDGYQFHTPTEQDVQAKKMLKTRKEQNSRT